MVVLPLPLLLGALGASARGHAQPPSITGLASEWMDPTQQISAAAAVGPEQRDLVTSWAPEFGGRNGFPPPENNELVLGCADTVSFQSKPNTPF